ncbi:CpsD/CapB family tyrosine-protein kinase [Thermodesulfobacteriota bacterium]
MGKISDALEKIDYLEERSIIDHRGGKEQIEESILPEAPSVIAIEEDANPVKVNGEWDERLSIALNNNSKLPKVFETLRSTIINPIDGTKVPQTIMVASSIAQEGKSFIAANLGVSFARGSEQHCLLVDINLLKPTLAQAFGINQKYGLADYLRDQADIAEVVIKTSLPKLSILPGGIAPDDSADLLSSPRMHALVEDLSNRYEDSTIIIDSPAMLTATESVVLSGQVDAILMIVRQGMTKKKEAQRFIDVVDETNILGIVINDILLEKSAQNQIM